MRANWRVIVPAVLLATLGGAVQAHHSFTATYFEDRTVEIQGKLLQFLFRNPHSFVHVEVADEKGEMHRWAVEWGGAGVRINSISPGPIADTEGMERLTPDAKAREKLTQLLPLGRFGTKSDVANLCLFLASDAGAYCTGGIHSVDGGMALIGGYLMQAMSG